MHALLRGSTFTGEQAVALGVADLYAGHPQKEATELATVIAELEPALARDIKRSVAIAAAGTFEASFGFESFAQAASSYAPGVREAIRAAGRTTRVVKEK
ncbi:hypothetical protein [Nocardia elegans]|uniref:hypothetical protein n=1 Tax=Nocardia elegans TaxID=300029 RepID=UPI001E34751A|nr:hypothetical protein [Nocardia elegans]